MKEISKFNRIILLFTSILAGYEIVSGVEGYPFHVIIFLTISFGVLLLACLLLIFLGFEILEKPIVVVFASLLPLGLSSSIIALKFPVLLVSYLLIGLAGFLTIILSRFLTSKKAAIISLSLVHGITGLVIFITPIFLFLTGAVQPFFLMVSLGGALIGCGGILLFFLKTKRPSLSNKQIYMLFPTLLFFMTISFIVGFSNSM